MLALGGISLTTSVGDIRQFCVTEIEPRTWFFEHIQYVSTNVRAVSVVLLSAIWETPVTVGTVAIWYVSQQYRDKIDRGTEPTASGGTGTR